MTRGQRLWLIYGSLALAAAGAASALVLTSNHEDRPTLTLILGELVGLSFIGAGLLGAWRRPANGTGKLLAWIGFLFAAGALSDANASLPFTVGLVVEDVFIAAFVHLLRS